MKYVVYILKSSLDGRYYVGSTGNLERRLLEHNSGQTKSTRAGKPWILCFKQEYADIKTSRQIESRLKKFKRRDLLERIIADGVIKLRPHGV